MIYLLERITDKAAYDQSRAFVIRASSEIAARALAQEIAADAEQSDCTRWLDARKTSCVVVEPEGMAELLCHDFRNG